MPIVDVILACLLRISRLGLKPFQDFPCSFWIGLAGHLFIRSAVRGAPLLLWRQLPPAVSRGIRRSGWVVALPLRRLHGVQRVKG